MLGKAPIRSQPPLFGNRFADLRLGELQPLAQRLGVRVQKLADRGQREARPASHDQPLAELSLQRSDLLRNGRLRERERSGGVRERSPLRDLPEDDQPPRIQHRSVLYHLREMIICADSNGLAILEACTRSMSHSSCAAAHSARVQATRRCRAALGVCPAWSGSRAISGERLAESVAAGDLGCGGPEWIGGGGVDRVLPHASRVASEPSTIGAISRSSQ